MLSGSVAIVALLFVTGFVFKNRTGIMSDLVAIVPTDEAYTQFHLTGDITPDSDRDVLGESLQSIRASLREILPAF